MDVDCWVVWLGGLELWRYFWYFEVRIPLGIGKISLFHCLLSDRNFLREIVSTWFSILNIRLKCGIFTGKSTKRTSSSIDLLPLQGINISRVFPWVFLCTKEKKKKPWPKKYRGNLCNLIFVHLVTPNWHKLIASCNCNKTDATILGILLTFFHSTCG